MVKANTALVSFSNGELSRKMRGRFDKPQYFSGCERLENFVSQTQGPANYRNGFRFIIGTKDNNPAALLPFQFNDEQSYVLEFTNLRLRIFLNDGILTEAAQNITNVTQANPAVVTYSGADNYDNGKEVFISGVQGMTELNGKFYTIANVNTAANTFELQGIDSTSFTAYTSGGTLEQVVEVTTPYTTAQLFELQTAQNADTMYIAHREHNPRTLTRTSATVWTLANHSPGGLTLSTDNYPGAVSFYEQRLVYAGTNNNPQQLSFSAAGNFNDFATGTGADEGLQFTIGSRDVNLIRWLVGTDRQLVVGTFGGNFIARGGDVNDPITPTNISVRPTDGIGAENQIPILHNNRVIFTERGQRTLRVFQFDLALVVMVHRSNQLIHRCLWHTK